MFDRLGRLVAARPGVCAVLWLMLAAVLVGVSPDESELAGREPRSLLPADQPYNESLAFEREAFPSLSSRTRTVLIFEADGGLSGEHQRYLLELSKRLEREFGGESGGRIQSPYLNPHLSSRLISSDGAAVMILVHSDSNYLTNRSVAEVDRIDQLVRGGLVEGLSFEITGEGGLGRDLSYSTKTAFERTTYVTLLALLFILVAVYRAPLAAMVPLVSIGISVVCALMVLNQLTRFGWGLSNIEKTFTVVLLFGSGTDFALFWLSRFREYLTEVESRVEAAARATVGTGPAILASGATTICGLLMLMSADLLPSYNAGRAVAVALCVALLAAITLVPAMALLMGKRLFWPRKTAHGESVVASRVWGAVAKVVVSRPWGAALAMVVLLLLPAWAGTHVTYTYDALGVVPADSGTARGEEMAKRHFSAAELFSWTCLVRGDGVATDLDGAVEQARELTSVCGGVEGVADVWSLSQPLGGRSVGALAVTLAGEAVRREAADFYISKNGEAMRVEVMLSHAPFSSEAMAATGRILDAVEGWCASNLKGGHRVFATGLTPYILNIKSVADRDNGRVTALVLVVIFFIVLALVRHLPLACLMLLATVAVYMVTLGATEWIFVHLLGTEGIDWKVKLFAFVILVAVGQDYNIFLVTRLLQERRGVAVRLAVRRSIVSTGAVISSCGLIMAATLGSLAATGLVFFQQLGVAFALGVLVDTFLIRPVFLPAVYLLMSRDDGIGLDTGGSGA